MPCAISAEQSVLGGVMLVNESLAKVSGWLKPEDFYRADHRLIFQTMLELAETSTPLDVVTLGEWFEANGLAEQVAGGSYLIELASTTPSAANVEAYAEIVKEQSQLRQLVESGTKLVNNALAPSGRRADELALEVSSNLLTMTGGTKRRGAKGMREVGARWFDELQKRHERGGGLLGVATPWAKFNRVTMGLCAGDLVIVCGRPSMGKSAVAVGLATSASLRGLRTLFFNLEMTDTSIFNRCVASVMGVPLKWLRAGGMDDDLSAEENDELWGKVAAGVSRFRDAPLLIDDRPGLTAAQIVACSKREHLRQKLDMILIDHLHLVKLGSGETHRELGDATAAFKALGKSLGCPVVVLSQLNRGLESRQNKRPQMQDLRESGAIEQDADLIVSVYRDDYYAEREDRVSEYPKMVELGIMKQREGEAGTTIWLRDRLDIGLLEDYDGDEPRRQAREEKVIRMRTRGDGRDRAAGDA